MSVPKYFKKHHLEYLRQNHKVLSLDRLWKGLHHLRLNVTKPAIKKQLTSMGLSWIEPVITYDPEKERARRNRKNFENKDRSLKKAEAEQKHLKIKQAIEKHYPTGGSIAVRNALTEFNIYLNSQKINALAKKYGVDIKRTQAQTKKLPKNLKEAFYKIRDYNERYGTSFSILLVDGDLGHIEDYYLATSKQDLVLGLLGEIYNLGYKIEKHGSKSFRIWGNIKYS